MSRTKRFFAAVFTDALSDFEGVSLNNLHFNKTNESCVRFILGNITEDK